MHEMARHGYGRRRALRHRVAGLAVLTMAATGMALPGAQAAERPAASPALALAQAETPPAQAGDSAELKALTEQVLQSLGAATGANAPRKPAPREPQASPRDYQSLMNALTTLVEKATRQGKSSEDVYALIQEALASEDEKRLQALLEQAGGKVGLQQLLRGLVRKAALKAAQPDDPYTRALEAEGAATRVTEGGARQAMAADARQPAAAGQERSIIVQRGDTLSIIALRVYGSVGKWRDIFAANRDRLNDPNLVPTGMRLRLP